MIRTTQETENFISPLSKMLNLENEPKWVVLRFMLNISLSLQREFESLHVENFDGKEYRLEQLTGEGKGADDHTKLYWDMVEAYDGITITSKKELEENLQKHILRGCLILKTSLKHDSNIFEFIGQDF
ncbi:DndE family protein [Sulfurospirillum sp. T05]|uniref:DndE family protein n=1 Tax=Sulfurospirillum tamanense TaxID=2813362 RepID=A0ABS2WUK2_9BACT|nr:DndE family protein [Sulfurospirillum tamanensis]MBN2965190.1 DndE family protein [Sulfurospirillum tamanensis]